MRIKKGFTLRTVMGQNVILAEGNNADNFGKMITLNSSAAMLWETLKGKDFSVEDAATILVDTYGIDRGTATADASRILTLMTEKVSSSKRTRASLLITPGPGPGSGSIPQRRGEEGN